MTARDEPVADLMPCDCVARDTKLAIAEVRTTAVDALASTANTIEDYRFELFRIVQRLRGL